MNVYVIMVLRLNDSYTAVCLLFYVGALLKLFTCLQQFQICVNITKGSCFFLFELRCCDLGNFQVLNLCEKAV